MRIQYKDMVKEFQRVLMKKGFNEEYAKEGAMIFADNSLDGVYSHGVNRFPRVVEYLEKDYIKTNVVASKESGFGGLEVWNGNLGLGNLNAKICMDRAIELAKAYGIGCVALNNNNHWMRGGAYGWQAADAGCIGICWTNTMPNMPAWGGQDRRIGNNPLIMAIPRKEGHIVADIAMSQFSYGKIEEYKFKNQDLPVPGGYDTKGEISHDPVEIEKTWRVLPIGFWKGSGLSIVLDVIATVLSGGNSTYEIGKLGDEYALSQILIAIDPSKNNTSNMEKSMNDTVDYIKNSIPVTENGETFYPGELEKIIRKENLELGIPVEEEVWNKIINM